MSNKAEVQINGVHIYTHLGGGNVKRRVADAIRKAEDKWELPDYLTRAIIDEMEKDATGETKGIGISSSSYDVLPRIHLMPGINKITVLDWNGKFKQYDTPATFIEQHCSDGCGERE